jgi:hypothetical protein
VPEDDVRLAVEFVRQTDLPYRDAWMEGLREGKLDAYLAILLLQLPHLRRLHFEELSFMESHLIGQVARTVLCRSHSDPRTPAVSTSLDQLEIVHLDSSLVTPGSQRSKPKTIQIPRNTANVLAFFYAPSLKEITITIDNPLGPVLPWPTDPPLALGLTSLRLGHLREPYLGPLLSIAPRLRSLHWEWGFEVDAEDHANTPVVDLDLLMPALAPLKDTLTELSIVAQCFHSYDDPAFPLRVQGSAKSLAGFHQLKKLFIPLAFLTGFTLPVRESLASYLPANLEDLTLTDELFLVVDEKNWDAQEACRTSAIRAWLADVKASTPRLRKLLLVLEFKDSEISSDALDIRNQIRKLACREGIEFGIERYHDASSLCPPARWGTSTADVRPD